MEAAERYWLEEVDERMAPIPVLPRAYCDNPGVEYFSGSSDLLTAESILRACAYRCESDSFGEDMCYRAIRHFDRRREMMEYRPYNV